MIRTCMMIEVSLVMLLGTKLAHAQKPFEPRYQLPPPFKQKPTVVYHADYGPLQGTPEDMALEYLRENRDLFGMRQDLSDLNHVLTQKSPAGCHVRFQQTFLGTPVYNSYTVVTINGKTSKISSVMSDYDPGVRVAEVTPILSEGVRVSPKQDLN